MRGSMVPKWRPDHRGFVRPSGADTATGACGPSANLREVVRTSTGTLASCVLVLAGHAAMAASELVAGSVAAAPGFRFRLEAPRPASLGQRKDYGWEEGPRRTDHTVKKQESLPCDLGWGFNGKGLWTQRFTETGWGATDAGNAQEREIAEEVKLFSTSLFLRARNPDASLVL